MMEIREDPDLFEALTTSERLGARVMVLRLMSVAGAFVATVLVSRALGPEGRGLYALPIVQMGVVMAVSHLGIEHANVYLAARGVELQRLWMMNTIAALLLSTGAGVVLAIAWVATSGSVFGGLPAHWLVLVMAQLPLLLASLFWASLLQLAGRLRSSVGRSAIASLSHLTCLALLFATGTLTTFRAVAVVWANTGLAFVLLFAQARALGLTSRLRLEMSLLIRALGVGIRAYAGLLIVMLLLRVDQLIVKTQLGFDALGIYSLAVVLAESVWLLTDPFAAALLPHQVYGTDGDERRLGYALARLNVTVAAIASAIAWIAAPHMIPLVFGERFSAAVWPFRLLLPGVMIFAIQRPLAQILLKEGRFRSAISFNVVALSVNVGANMLLLRRFGVGAASVVSTVTYVAVACGYVIATRRAGVTSWRALVPSRLELKRLAQVFR
jgi:O-antigen/teichoic acid export membrane protein